MLQKEETPGGILSSTSLSSWPRNSWPVRVKHYTMCNAMEETHPDEAAQAAEKIERYLFVPIKFENLEFRIGVLKCLEMYKEKKVREVRC